jgi:DUF917 family protein
MHLSASDLEGLALGCAVLGSGGGGDTDVALLQALAAIERHGPVEVVDVETIDADGLVMPVAGWGSPTVGIEKLGSGEEGHRLAEAVERWFGRPVAAVMAGEIGGGNGVWPVALAAELGLPLVDADGMGRAFPEGPMVSMHVAGLSPAPVFLADEHGNVITLTPVDGDWYERIVRHLVVACGGSLPGADFIMTGAQARNATVRGTVSRALALGSALANDGLAGLVQAADGFVLATGIVSDVVRRTTGGFSTGVVTIEDGSRAPVLVHVQNENLLAESKGEPLAMVPDLIVLVDEATGHAVPTERVQYGQRVSALGIPCAPLWRTEAGLAVAGPQVFDYPHAYTPVEQLNAELGAHG